MPGDLRVRRPIVGQRRRNRLRLAEFVDLHDPGRDCTAGGMPDQAGREAAAEDQCSEEGEPPVPRLDSCGSYPLIPDLAGSLIGRFRIGRLAVTDCWPPKHGYSPSERST